MLRRISPLPATCSVVVALACGTGSQPLLVVEQNLLAHVQMLLPAPPPPRRLVVLAIDDFSLDQASNGDLLRDPLLPGLQSWPWARASYARVLDRLAAAGARVVGIDLLLEAPSSHGEADDRTLARALARFPGTVVLGSRIREPRHGGGAGYSLVRPYGLLLGPAAGRQPRLGLLNAREESDGAIRQPPQQYAQWLRQQTPLLPPDSLGRELHRVGGGGELAAPGGPWQPNLRFYGPPGTIRTLPIWDMLDARRYQQLKNNGVLKDAFVLIGPAAPSFQDRYTTAYAGSEGMPGVEIHATEYANLRDGRTWYLLRPEWPWAAALGLALLGLTIVLDRLPRPLSRIAAGLGCGATVATLHGLSLSVLHLGLPLLSLVVGVTLVSGTSAGEATFRLQRERLRLRRTLSRYLSPAVADEVTRQREAWEESLVGRQCEVVVILCDIRGFTSKTTEYSKSGRAAELVSRLNQYFALVVNELMREGATVDKFIGDAVLAYFGAPLSAGREADAEAAIRAAIRMTERLPELNASWEQQGLEPWQQVIVLSAGTVICGNIGSPQRLDYTVIGDAVNRASRLEAVAKETGALIVASDTVIERATNHQGFERLGEFALRGQGMQAVYGILPHAAARPSLPDACVGGPPVAG